MQALRFEKTGSLDNLSLANIEKPPLAPGEALVRVKAAGINGSDAAAVLGILPFVTTPRTPGRDFSGQVVEALDDSGVVLPEWVGADVWGTGSERGFTSDGTFAEYVKVPVTALSQKPKTLSHCEAASMTLPWLCAWITVDTLANVKKGDNVIIIGARGGIGSAAAQLCKDQGARIFGTFTSLANVTPPSYLTPIELTSSTAIREAIAKEGLQNKIDVLLDCAGYETPFNDALFTMTPVGTGRVVVMAAHAKDGLFPINMRTFYTKALTMKGMKSSILNSGEIKAFLDELSSKIDSGAFEGPKAIKTVDMRDMGAVRAALQEILTRAAHVRSVIVP
ncbi:chaperonin 10-like protein [Pisolithus orientalis]|uniref:chaperonin 10-like protein n=1 Tax=Pisolithus orientalis TaxID=936130 RepID=UPI0022249CD5|nr:chaperonin 10-like protein [Pisolithus orientalis]KAI6008863.1 chaperonin 10-like protein [Pisolithus orientalis]